MNQSNYSGCLMLYLNIPNYSKLIDKIITNKQDIIEIEPNPHITILYGLSTQTNINSLKRYINNYRNVNDITTDRIDYFQSGNNDVLKFKINGNSLYELNRIIKFNFDNENNYPLFVPHLTIAYLKLGSAEKYIKRFKKEFKLNPKYFVYSINGKLIKL